MTPLSNASRSLTARLLIGVALPIMVLALTLGIGGALMIRTTVGSVNDRILDAASRGIADSLTVEDGEVALDLSPTIFGMLENTARDNVYYSVRQSGTVLTGYPDLVQVTPGADGDVATFVNGRYLGHDVRIVARVRRLPGLTAPLIVEVAETLDARAADTHRLWTALAVLLTVLVIVAVLLLPVAVRWGLHPMARVRDNLDRRAASDLTPVPLATVPSELSDLVAAFNAMLARLADAIAGIRRFTGDASHQMRTPLSILRTHVAALRNAPPGSVEAQQSIADIDAGSIRLSHLIAQLLALARADNAVTTEAQTEVVDLADLLALVVGELEDAAALRDVSLTVEGSAVLARTSPALATELLANLVDNAVRHGDAGGAVCIRLEKGPAIAVEDNGPGIPAADRERVFERFARLSPYGERGGSGLGLSIARSLAQATGSRLILEDRPGGRGLRAVVHFPPALKA